MRLEDRREFADERLRALLRDSSVGDGAAPLSQHARIGDKRGVPLLLAALKDTSSLVQTEAAFGLGLLRDTSAEVIRRLSNQARCSVVQAHRSTPAPRQCSHSGASAETRSRDC